MERKTKAKKKPLWRKVTPGKLYLRRKPFEAIRPQQKTYATEEEIKHWMPDSQGVYHFVLIDPGSYDIEIPGPPDKDDQPIIGKATEMEAKSTSSTSTKKEKYEVRSTGHGWFDVYSSSGKKMNENGLREADAKDLVNQLEKETTVEEEPE